MRSHFPGELGIGIGTWNEEALVNSDTIGGFCPRRAGVTAAAVRGEAYEHPPGELFEHLPRGEGGLRPARFPFAIVRVGKETRYEAAIPWKSLPRMHPEAGCRPALALVVNEGDGGGRGRLGWQAGIAADKDPALFGQVTLTASSANVSRDQSRRE